MSSFLGFISAAADFVLTLNLKAAIVAAGFILMLMLTRRRGARIAPEGKAPDRPRHQGPPRPCECHRADAASPQLKRAERPFRRGGAATGARSLASLATAQER